MFEGASDTLIAAPGTAANGLDVDVTRVSGTVTVDGSGVTQPISGTVTANLSATDNAVLDAIEIDTTTIAGAVSGTEMQVDVITMPTVAVTGTFWQATQPVSLASVPSHAVTNAGTFAVQVDGDALTALQLIDDTVYVDDADWTDSTSKHLLVGGLYQSSPQTVADGDVAPFNITANGALHVSDAGGSLTVDNAGLTELAGAINASSQMDVNIAAVGTSLFVEQPTASALNVTLGAGTNAIGRVGHDITGNGHGVTTVTTAGTDVALAGSTTCKRVVIQAQTDNTNPVAVGATGVDATIATGTGILLFPGDVYELEIDNLADIFIDSITNGEGVRYHYFTQDKLCR